MYAPRGGGPRLRRKPEARVDVARRVLTHAPRGGQAGRARRAGVAAEQRPGRAGPVVQLQRGRGQDVGPQQAVDLRSLLAAPAVAHAKLRVAVPDFKIEGDGTPALSLQLQDGCVLGLVRAGVQVLDPVDVGRKLESAPELRGCESSPCLKNIGRLLSVRYVLRVKIEVSGNTYKMVARLYSHEGDAPAALPVSTKPRTCDVCTVAEAREYMLR